VASVELRSRPRPAGPERRGANRGPSAPWTLITLLIIVAVAGWLRFASLGRLSFWADEFPHAVAARGLLDEGKPILPSGREYRRAEAQTVAVAASMRVFGENEAAARLPSAAVGLLTVPLLWLALRRRFGEGAALAAAAIVAVMPLHVAHSRSARFYAAFVLAYFAAAVLGSRAIRTRSWRAGVIGLGAFAVAMHLQVAAVIVLAPLAAYAVLRWRTAPERHRAGRARAIAALASVAALGALLVVAVPPMREGALRLLRHPVPDLELDPGLHLATFGNLFGLIAWWAWIPLLPAAIAGIRRAGIEGWNLVLQLLVPAILLAVLFRTTDGSGLDRRYMIHLVPFLAAIAGIGIAELGRRAAARIRFAGSPRRSGAVLLLAALVGALSVAGATGVAALPHAPHPGKVIPRPNWNAAAAVVRAGSKPGDGLLSTGPLAVAWTIGRCGEWLRTTAAAAPFMIGSRDINCGSGLVPDAASADAYIDAHPRGWVVADPVGWVRSVDPGARAVIEQRARRVDVGDSSILLWRWGP
jgi:4-amino-4-deoxy-L-arabinose transferase-like glycosyltransferase